MPSESRSQLDELAQSQPWFTNRIEFPNSPAGMLGHSEATLYYHLAKTVFRGAGTIVDAGSFLGKSAYYLAQGLRANPNYAPERDRIHCFDNFIVNGYDTVEFVRIELSRTMAIGDSTRQIFTSNVAPVADMLDIHDGDFHTIPWPHQPIEILVVDIAKNEELGSRVIGSFFQDLIPGESLVIHQDYHHPWLPHIHITMEYLADYFELVIPRVDDSAVFLCRKAIPPDVLQRAAEYHFTEAEKVALMNAAISRLPSEHRYYVALAGIVLRSEMVDPATIREELDQLERQFQENGRNYSLNPYFGGVRNHIDIREGWQANGEGRFERCLELSGQILARERTSTNLTMRGCALMGLNRYPEAEDQFREALLCPPPAAWAYLELARAVMLQNRLGEAESILLSGFPTYIRDEVDSRYYLDYLGSIWRLEVPLADKTRVLAMLRRDLPGDPEVWVLDARRLAMTAHRDGARNSLEVAAQMGLPETRFRAIREELEFEE